MSYQLQNKIAIISIDDGKANVFSHDRMDQLNADLDRAEKEAAAVIVTGREGMFSAGFDLKTIKLGPEEAEKLINRGMEVLTRLYQYPLPVISACGGHAMGQGAFLLLASDHRIGAEAEYQVTLPETAIGMPFPPALMILAHDRLSPNFKNQAVLQSKPYTAQQAVQAGFLDELVAPEELLDKAMELAEKMAELPAEFFAINKRDLRAASLQAMQASLK